MLELRRYGSSPAGTPGVLRVSDVFSCYTIEQPWVCNIPMKSCIPIGKYTVRKDRFNKGGYDAYEVDNVLGRSEIKIHVGNSIKDILGCVLVGEGLLIQDGLWWLTASQKTFDKFMHSMGGVQTAELLVRNAYPVQEGELWEVQ